MSSRKLQPGRAALGGAAAVPAPRFVAALDHQATAWTRLDRWIVVGVMLIGLLLYLVRLGQPPQYIYDEVYHAYTAARLAEGKREPYMFNTSVPQEDRARFPVAYEWSHPALAKLLMQPGILIFGDTPFGWRIASAIFGALGLGLFYALGHALLGRPAALIGAVLLLCDGLWFVQSRTAMNDIFLVCFLLLGYLAFFRYLQRADRGRWRALALAGVGLGLALATKWSALYSLGLLGLVAAGREGWRLVRAWRTDRRALQRALGVALLLAAIFVALPLALYVGGYAQFFAMGYTWQDWWALQGQMRWYHTHLTACHDWASPWWSWPLLLRPVWYYVMRFDGLVANVFALGNPLIWWLFLPAIAYVARCWWQRRCSDVALGLILLGFLGQWLPWALSPRISYLYHMLPSLPFGVLALAYGLDRLRRQTIRWDGGALAGYRLTLGYLVLVVLTFLFFYPHYSGVPIPPWLSAAHYWLPSWNPNVAWPFNCPQPTLLSRLLTLW